MKLLSWFQSHQVLKTLVDLFLEISIILKEAHFQFKSGRHAYYYAIYIYQTFMTDPPTN